MEDADWSSPNCVGEITEEWVYHLMFHICRLSPERRKGLNITSINIDSNLNSGEGALSDICHVSVSGQLNNTFCEENEKDSNISIASNKHNGETNELMDIKTSKSVNTHLSFNSSCNTQNEEDNNGFHENGCHHANLISYNLFIKLVPEGLKEFIDGHGLFFREITFYRY